MYLLARLSKRSKNLKFGVWKCQIAQDTWTVSEWKKWMLCMLCDFISCLRLAAEQHCTLPQKGGKWEGFFLIVHELKTDTLLEVDEELLTRVKWFGKLIFLLYQNSDMFSTYFIERCLVYFTKHLHRTKGCEALKNTCQPYLINWLWESKLPSSGEARNWWNFETLQPNQIGGRPTQRN